MRKSSDSHTRSFPQKLWTRSEIEQLRVLSEQGVTEKEIAKSMKRSLGSVRGEKYQMRIRSGKMWTQASLEQLKYLVQEGKSNQESAVLMGRTRSAIQQAKFKLGLGDYSVRKWTKKEEIELRQLALEMTTAELAQHFNREWTAIDRKCKSLGIRTQSKQVVILGPFTEEEDTYIITHSWYRTNLQLAEKLSRTEGSIKQRKTRLRKRGFQVASYTERGRKFSK
ncbi:MAG: hypothetical protein LBI13_01610 [Streptococcaceae bacterium]|jgi:DNA-binding CsgD family transcriptional regulator|nr:hypothetical protein [Streptococcaceae bacterium]